MDLPKASSFTLDFLCKTKVEGLLGVPLLYDLCTMITATGPPKPPEKRGLQEVASSAIPVSSETQRATPVVSVVKQHLCYLFLLHRTRN